MQDSRTVCRLIPGADFDCVRASLLVANAGGERWLMLIGHPGTFPSPGAVLTASERRFRRGIGPARTSRTALSRGLHEPFDVSSKAVPRGLIVRSLRMTHVFVGAPRRHRRSVSALRSGA